MPFSSKFQTCRASPARVAAAMLALALSLCTVAGGAARAADPPESAPAAPRTGHDGDALTIGVAGLSGLYFRAATAICHVLNTQSGTRRCALRPGAGSVDNANRLRDGKLEWAIVSSDLPHRFRAGDAGRQQLRSVVTLFPEYFTLVLRDGLPADAARLRELRINIGNVGSSVRVIAEDLMPLFGMPVSQLALATALDGDEIGGPYCARHLDGFAVVYGAPAPIITRMLRRCGGSVIPVATEGLQDWLRIHPGYEARTIPAGIYPGNPAATPTLAVFGTLVTTQRSSDQAVYRITREIFENLDTLRELLPWMRELDPARMVQVPGPMPLHKGALRYYRERGWIAAEEAGAGAGAGAGPGAAGSGP